MWGGLLKRGPRGLWSHLSCAMYIRKLRQTRICGRNPNIMEKERNIGNDAWILERFICTIVHSRTVDKIETFGICSKQIEASRQYRRLWSLEPPIIIANPFSSLFHAMLSNRETLLNVYLIGHNLTSSVASHPFLTRQP